MITGYSESAPTKPTGRASGNSAQRRKARRKAEGKKFDPAKHGKKAKGK